MERVHLADRASPARPGADATPPVDCERLDEGVPPVECALPALRAARARAKRARPLPRPAGRPLARRRAAPLVGHPPGEADARDPPDARRDRGRRPPGEAASLGSGRPRLSGDRVDPLARGRASDPRAASPVSRSLAGARQAPSASGDPRRARPGPRRLPLTVRPARPRPRACRSALRIPLSPRDVRAEGRSGSTATTCSRSSTATGSSAGSTSSAARRRAGCRSTASGGKTARNRCHSSLRSSGWRPSSAEPPKERIRPAR